MAGKIKTIYICSECGYESHKWTGQCAGCGSWNTMCEQIVDRSSKTQAAITDKNVFSAKSLDEISCDTETRFVTKISELDRVLGGGIVKGSVVLLSGDPGIGKSTILLQICNAFKDTFKILYVSGEESATQIKIRAARIGVTGQNISVMTETDVMSVCEYIKSTKPDIVMIDSIQTMQISELSSSAGSIVQVRESTNMLLRTGKSLNIPILIVGHVNKGGDIAGPKVMEHIVDTVLYFEGERNQSYRILRAIKNRFGSTNEIGVFEMSEQGLKEVQNPSAMMLSGRLKNVSGDCITCIMEGTRPILTEIQALVTTTGFGNPRRQSAGFDYNRLNLILAVLEKRIGIYFSNLDVYLNVVGGMKIDGPTSDLAVCMALVSAIRDVPLNEGMIAIGEIGLSGEVRSVPGIERRINEAARLGFTECVLPKSCIKQITCCPDTIKLIGVRKIDEAFSLIR